MDDLISRAAALEVIDAVKGFVWSQSGKVLCGKIYSQIKDIPAVDEELAPRVMTLHEIDDVINIASEEYKRIFWAEVRSKTRKSFGVFQLDIASEDCYEALLLGCSWPACYKRSTYGIRWRCWTSCPTDEQRRNEPWRG